MAEKGSRHTVCVFYNNLEKKTKQFYITNHIYT